MQTYTHAAIGALVGTAVFPESYMAQLACVTGAVAPDVALAPKFALDKLRGKQAFAEQSQTDLLVKELSHSFFVWLGLWLLGWWMLPRTPWWPWAIFTGICLGGLSHLVVDALTHCAPRFRDTDQGLLWPFRTKLGGIVGVWEYRYDHGVLMPKPFEALVLVAATALTAWLHL